MMMMGTGSMWMMVLSSLLTLFVVLGFGYIVWIMAAKESGNSKLAGQIISVVIIVLAVVLCLYGMVKGGRMRHQMMGQGAMMQQQQMPAGMEKTHETNKMMRGNWKK